MTTHEQESGTGVAVRQLDEENMRYTTILGPANETVWKGPRGYSCNTTREQRERDQRGPKLVTLWPQRGITGSLSSPVGSGNQAQAPPDTMKQTLSSQCLSTDLYGQPHLHTSRNGELTACRAGPLEGSVCGDLIVRAAASVLCPSAPDDRAGALGAMALSELSTDCSAHAGPPAPSNQSHFQLCPRDCSSKGCPKPHSRVQPAHG